VGAVQDGLQRGWAGQGPGSSWVKIQIRVALDVRGHTGGFTLTLALIRAPTLKPLPKPVLPHVTNTRSWPDPYVASPRPPIFC